MNTGDEIGAVRTELALSLQRTLDQIVKTRNDKRPYYILVHGKPASPGSNEIVTKIVITHQKPPKLQASMCYYVDNQKGLMKRLWVLPFDIPRVDLVHTQGDHDQMVEEVYRSAQDQIVLH